MSIIQQTGSAILAHNGKNFPKVLAKKLLSELQAEIKSGKINCSTPHIDAINMYQDILVKVVNTKGTVILDLSSHTHDKIKSVRAK